MKKAFLITCIAAVCCIFLANTQNSLAANSPRKVLAEEATNASCGPCASQNPSFQAWLAVHSDRVIPVVYHAWWPGPNDPMYLYDINMQKGRITYYGINGVPSARINGKIAPKTGTWYDGAVGDIDALNAFLDQQPTESPFNIKVVLENKGVSGKVVINVSTGEKPLTSAMLRVVLCERYHYYSDAGSNGEKDFFFLARKMLPDYNGTNISLAPGEAKNFQFDYTIDADFSEDLYAVAFLQDDKTKEVLQVDSASDLPDYALLADFSGGGVNVIKGNTSSEFQYTIKNNTAQDATFNVIAEKSSRTPGDWSAEPVTVDGTVTVPANSTSTVKMKFNCGSTTAIGDACLVLSPSNEPDSKYKGSYFTLVSEDLQSLQVLDGEKDHSLESVAQKYRGMYSFPELPSSDFMNIFDKMTNLKNIVWNTSTTGTMTSTETEFLVYYINSGINVMVTGGSSVPSMDQGGALGFFGVGFQAWSDEGYGQAPWRIWLSGVGGDPITGYFGKNKEGNLIAYLTAILKITDPSIAKPILSHAKHQDTIVAVRVEKENNQRLILLGINPFIIVDTGLRDRLIKNCLDWLETGITPVEEDNPESRDIFITASPNPADGYIRIEYNTGAASGSLRLSLVDTYGQEIRLVKSGTAEPGANTITTSTEGLSSGSYRLLLNAGCKTASYPVVIVK